MAFGFRKSIKLAPGVRLTMSKRGASVSGGPKGAKLSTNTRGETGIGRIVRRVLAQEAVGAAKTQARRTRMSVIMLQWVKGDPRRLEEYAAQNPEGIPEIVAQAKEHGLIAHRFYGSEGQILIADEWPDEESFVRFAEAAGSRIEPMFEAAGLTAEPPTFWRKLDTRDEVGWGA